MKNADVKYIMIDQTDHSPFLIRIREQYFNGEERLSIPQRLLYPMKNAAFGYDLVSTIFYAGEELPKHWGWPDLHRAFECLRNEVETKRTDPACHEALALGHPGNVQAQESLKGYLCSGLDYQQVGSRCGKSTEVVSIFAHLYCDFLERSDSPEFVRGVLDPQCKRGSFETDLADLASIEDPVLRAMNFGYFYGPEVLVKSLGKPHDPRTVNDVQLLSHGGQLASKCRCSRSAVRAARTKSAACAARPACV
jgi:hypothetical protein